MTPVDPLVLVLRLAFLGLFAAYAMRVVRRGDRAWERRVYADVARAAWRDGVLTRSERSLLARIATALRLARVEAWWIERTVRWA